ncbi:hypothetical protein DITRI_Ditri16bG0122200 [Diplodiscus trichospermus]
MEVVINQWRLSSYNWKLPSNLVSRENFKTKAYGGFYLPPGQTRRFEAPWSWNGRIWARTGCNFNSNWQPTCEIGDCDGRLQCNRLIGTPPATLVQVALQGDKGKPNFYDVSLVDCHNLPVSVAT